MLKYLIVEDEIPNQKTLKNLLDEYCVNIEFLCFAQNVEEAIQSIDHLKPDLVFLDIELQTGTAFEVLREISHRDFDIIFTTAYEHYAIKAIKYAAIDYLLKPIDIKELQEAVHKAHSHQHLQNFHQRSEKLLKNLTSKKEEQVFALKLSDGFKFIHPSDIVYCQADGSYTQIHLVSGEQILQSTNLKEYEKMFHEIGFIRVHHSYLINSTQIDRFVKGKNASVFMKDGTEISVSAKRRDEFLEKMKLI
ncbi:MAG: LytTR family DNA-binding domain-containing protein [Bacteroidota bacterium]